MKCSRCGTETKNLPEYLVDTETELLCTKCSGTADRRDDAVNLFHRYRYGRNRFTIVDDSGVEVAA